MKTLKLAIIGFGPRGLAALEALTAACAGHEIRLSVHVFDPFPWHAAGPNFSPDEALVCQLNIPMRAVEIPADSGFPGFADWARDVAEDEFPPRAMLGRYFTERFDHLRQNWPATVDLACHRSKVSGLTREGPTWRLTTADLTDYFDDVLMTLGQPATQEDKQISAWRKHASANGLTLCGAYPGRGLIERAADWTGEVVAVRGLGLASLDVIRALTLGLGGRFTDGCYHPSGREPSRIVPFSMDGRAPYPKPATAALDARFDPSPAETATFVAALKAAFAAEPPAALSTICEAMVAPALRVLRACGASVDEATMRDWLETERDEPGAQTQDDTVTALRAGIAEAEGSAPPSIGYVIGQLWRKWQGELRDSYRRAELPLALAEALTGFDEGLKRYSYGAPIETARQLLILIDAGIVDPRLTEDPDIGLRPKGWLLNEGDQQVMAPIMVDGVLPPPRLSDITDDIFVALRDSGVLVEVGEGLGARTTAEGAVIDRPGATVPGLWLLGRMANGSVIAFDSIHDCFGDTTKDWARAVAERA